MFSTFSQLVVSAEQSQKIKRFISFDNKPILAKTGLIVITGDKGLCGDFNSSIIKEAERTIKNPDNNISVFLLLGEKHAIISGKIKV